MTKFPYHPGHSPTIVLWEIVESPVFQGNRALAVTVQTAGDDPWNIEAIQDEVAVSPNTTYRYTAWVRGPEGTSVDFTVGLPNFDELARSSANLTGVWQRVNFEFTTGDGESVIRLPIHFSRAANEGQTIYIDNVQVTPVN